SNETEPSTETGPSNETEPSNESSGSSTETGQSNADAASDTAATNDESPGSSPNSNRGENVGVVAQNAATGANNTVIVNVNNAGVTQVAISLQYNRGANGTSGNNTAQNLVLVNQNALATGNNSSAINVNNAGVTQVAISLQYNEDANGTQAIPGPDSGANFTAEDTARLLDQLGIPLGELVTTERNLQSQVFEGENGTKVRVTVNQNVTIGFPIEREVPDEERLTRDEISQAKYGYDFAALSAETTGQVEEIYNRQPFAGQRNVTDVLTREEIARQQYDKRLKNVNREQIIEIENTYHEQFACSVEQNSTYTRDEISQAKYGYDFAALSTETTGQVQEIYNRQPFSDSFAPEHVLTREEIARQRYGADFDNLGPKERIQVQDLFDIQFQCTADAMAN
ncbi:hypothetical protein ELS19_14545, partial [Halogeometricum borinquense]